MSSNEKMEGQRALTPSDVQLAICVHRHDPLLVAFGADTVEAGLVCNEMELNCSSILDASSATVEVLSLCNS